MGVVWLNKKQIEEKRKAEQRRRDELNKPIIDELRSEGYIPPEDDVS